MRKPYQSFLLLSHFYWFTYSTENWQIYCFLFFTRQIMLSQKIGCAIEVLRTRKTPERHRTCNLSWPAIEQYLIFLDDGCVFKICRGKVLSGNASQHIMDPTIHKHSWIWSAVGIGKGMFFKELRWRELHLIMKMLLKN